MQKATQEQQVIDVLRNAGGYATLRRLNELVDFSTWATKTPEAVCKAHRSEQSADIQDSAWSLGFGGDARCGVAPIRFEAWQQEE